MVPGIMHLFSRLRVGGHEAVGTAFFCDLRGYTTLSEQLPPEELSRVLNRYTTTVADVVAKHGGRPIDYLGDGVFALFEESRAVAAHPVRAVRAALEAWQAVAGPSRLDADDTPLDLGIGLHTGRMIIGVVGAERLMRLGAGGMSSTLLRAFRDCPGSAATRCWSPAEAHTGLGLALQLQGRETDALAEHQAALTAAPRLAVAQANLAALYLQQGKLAEAQRTLAEGLRDDPDLGYYYILFSEALLYRQQLMPAQECAPNTEGLL